MTSIPQNPSLNKSSKVALIGLDCGVSSYAETQSFIAWKLRREGCDIVRFGCAAMLDTCISINSTGKVALSANERDQICERCRGAQRDITAGSVFEVNDKDEIAGGDASSYLDELKRRLASSNKVSEVLDMDYTGLPLCRIAFFDFSIVTKLGPDSILDLQSINRFIAGVRDLVKLYHAFERFRKQYDVTHIVYVNGNYTQNTLARHVFESKGVICLSIEPQLTSQHMLNRVMLVPDRLSLHPEGLLQSEANYLSANVNYLSDIQSVLKNFGARIEGMEFNAYTSLKGQDIADEDAKRFGKFLEIYKRVHSFFLSSEDELTPHIITHGASMMPDPNPFGPYRTQLEFTSYLLKAAASHSEIGFVIRLHPRMAANKRDHFESEEHVRYKTLMAEINIPENVFVLYGDSKISSYFVISKSDLVIVSWSTIGLEALLLGTPVVSVFPYYLMYPLSAFTHQPTNYTDMVEALFTNSRFGVADERKLLEWVSMAYEGQFFATTAPRGERGILGRIYRISLRVSKRTGMYGFLAWLVDFIFLNRVILDQEYLLQQKKKVPKKASTHLGSANKLLIEYRKKCHHVLHDYGQRVFHGN